MSRRTTAIIHTVSTNSPLLAAPRFVLEFPREGFIVGLSLAQRRPMSWVMRPPRATKHAECLCCIFRAIGHVS